MVSRDLLGLFLYTLKINSIINYEKNNNNKKRFFNR